jgi:diguanylate cyclase (GGDEF)-like protein
LRGKERGKHDLVLVKTGKPCNKSHAKENPNACCKVGQTFHEAGVARFQGVGVAAEKPRAGGRADDSGGWKRNSHRPRRRLPNCELRRNRLLLDILNRRGFARELTRAVAFIARYSATGALIVLDVDRLKPINDAFGHAAGDIVLKAVVGVLRRHVRASDVIGRLGGDEFVLLLWNVSEVDARAKAQVLEAAIDQLTFVFRDINVSAGASAGVALLGPDVDGEAALVQADRAMYVRKTARRAKV